MVNCVSVALKQHTSFHPQQIQAKGQWGRGMQYNYHAFTEGKIPNYCDSKSW